ncbi:MAG: hypothetical protein Q7S39_08020 [Ignavibacteria bacterium]|nr:hypothetical protein [Ignavibacteria bacterium]
MKYLINFLNFLNQNLGAVQTISTIVLVVITAWYAISTKRMANLMRDQITSKIIIENPSIGSQFTEKWILERSFDKQSFLNIIAVFDIRNEGNASGSLYKPYLEISLSAINLSFKISPRTKSYESYNHQSSGAMSSYDTRTINHGASIFLQGGASDRIELDYYFNINTDDRLNFVNEAKKNPLAIKYYLVTKDNFGKEYKIIVSDVKEERDFGIK